jgi:hypothetical protein
MALDVVRRLSQQDWIVSEATETHVAGWAQQVANLSGRVVVVDAEGALAGGPATDRAQTVLSGELLPIVSQRQSVQLLTESFLGSAQVRQRRFRYLPFCVTCASARE